MAETRMPYGITGRWFVRVPCWISSSPCPHGTRLDVVSRDSGRTLSIAVRKSRQADAMAVFQELSRIYDHRTDEDMAGVDDPRGAHAVVLYGMSCGKNAQGLEVLDLSVQGGALKVEPADD